MNQYTVASTEHQPLYNDETPSPPVTDVEHWNWPSSLREKTPRWPEFDHLDLRYQQPHPELWKKSPEPIPCHLSHSHPASVSSTTQAPPFLGRIESASWFEELSALAFGSSHPAGPDEEKEREERFTQWEARRRLDIEKWEKEHWGEELKGWEERWKEDEEGNVTILGEYQRERSPKAGRGKRSRTGQALGQRQEERRRQGQETATKHASTPLKHQEDGLWEPLSGLHRCAWCQERDQDCYRPLLSGSKCQACRGRKAKCSLVQTGDRRNANLAQAHEATFPETRMHGQGRHKPSPGPTQGAFRNLVRMYCGLLEASQGDIRPMEQHPP